MTSLPLEPDSDSPFLTVAQAAARIRARELSPVELVRACLDRVARFDPQINAFISLFAERAMNEARTAEAEIARGHWRGPLHGIPYALKDIFDAAGAPTTGHSAVDRHRVPDRSATVVNRLAEAGAILLGKLATHEFSSGGPSLDLPWPPARNPWDTDRFTGGSSSGSGAAVAAAFVPFTLGADSGGSIRIPAALCGVAGLKPTYGRVSRHGVVPGSWTFDHCGPLAWTTQDCALVLGAIAGHDAADRSSARVPVADYPAALGGDLRGVRIGVVRHFWEEEAPVDAEAARAMDAALDVLAGLGASLEETRLRTRREYNDVMMLISKCEMLAIFEKELRERPGDFGADFVGRTMPACLFQAGDWLHAQRERRCMIDEMEQLYKRFDVLVTATSAPAGRLDQLVGAGALQRWGLPNIYCAFNITGGPALSVCNGFSSEGLPLGMQIAGRLFDEATVLKVGDAYERATVWRQRRPKLDPRATARPIVAMPPAVALTAIDPNMKTYVDASLRRAGLVPEALQLEQLYVIAPAALAVADRLRRDRPREQAPADVYCFTECLTEVTPSVDGHTA